MSSNTKLTKESTKAIIGYDRKIVFGIIGEGHAARLHQKAIAKIELAELGFIRQTLDRRWIDQCDVICICTPHATHMTIAKTLLHNFKFSGKLIIEKPVAINDPEKDLGQFGLQNWKEQLIPVLQNRYNPLIQVLHTAVKQARFGKIFMINGSVLWNRSNEYYEQSEWRGTAKHKDGVLLNQAIHTLDLMQLMGNGIKKTQSFLNLYNHNIDMEDLGIVNIVYNNGAMGQLKATTCMYRQNHETRIEVFGTHGTAIIGGKALNEVIEWDFAIEQPEDHKIKLCKNIEANANEYGKYQGSGAYHKEFLEAVCDCILENKPNPIEFEEVFESLNCILKIYKSEEIK